MKVAWIGPCVGIGGADAYMLSMIEHMKNTECVGIAINDDIKNIDWVRKFYKGPIHQPLKNARHRGCKYHKTFGGAVEAVARDADIVICWALRRLDILLKNVRKPTVYIIQNSDEFEASCLESMNVDYKVAVSQACALTEVDAIIHNAVDANRCTPRMGREESRKAWGISDQEKLIIFSGRMVEEKWPQSLIQALIKLPPEWRGMYVGTGYLEKDLYEEASRWGLGNRLMFMPQQFHLGDVYAAADCFLLPSDFEGLPLALLEAWLAGCRTVVSDMPCVMELCQSAGIQLSTIIPRRCSVDVLIKGILQSQDFDPGPAHAFVWSNFTASTAAYRWEVFLAHALFQSQMRRNVPNVYPVKDKEPNTTSVVIKRA